MGQLNFLALHVPLFRLTMQVNVLYAMTGKPTEDKASTEYA